MSLIVLPKKEFLDDIFKKSGCFDQNFRYNFIQDYHSHVLYRESVLFILKNYLSNHPIDNKEINDRTANQLSHIAQRIIDESSSQLSRYEVIITGVTTLILGICITLSFKYFQR